MDISNTSVALLGCFGVAEIILIALAGYYFSQLVGSLDTSNNITKTLLPVTGILGGIVLTHTILWYIYFTYRPSSMNLYFLVATSMSMIVSLTALSISLVNTR
jgi:hypothetical protein